MVEMVIFLHWFQLSELVTHTHDMEHSPTFYLDLTQITDSGTLVNEQQRSLIIGLF